MKYRDSFRVFRVKDSETHWVVADSVLHAIDIVAKELGHESLHQYKDEVDEVVALPWFQELTMTDEHEVKTAKTCAELARSHRGFIGSTVGG